MRVTAPEIPRPDVPDQVAARFKVIAADAAFTRVMRESAHFRAAVQGKDGVGRQCPEAHRRNVEH